MNNAVNDWEGVSRTYLAEMSLAGVAAAQEELDRRGLKAEDVLAEWRKWELGEARKQVRLAHNALRRAKNQLARLTAGS